MKLVRQTALFSVPSEIILCFVGCHILGRTFIFEQTHLSKTMLLILYLIWLVVLAITILKNDGAKVNGKDDIPYMKWKIKNIWNHQPVIIYMYTWLVFPQNSGSKLRSKIKKFQATQFLLASGAHEDTTQSLARALAFAVAGTKLLCRVGNFWRLNSI